MSGRNILYRYTIEYADKHREALNKITTLAELDSLFTADKTLFTDFVNYASKQGVRPNPKEVAKSREVIEAQLKAYNGRNTVLEDNAFYYNIFPIDNVVHKALEIISSEPLVTTDVQTAEGAYEVAAAATDVKSAEQQ